MILLYKSKNRSPMVIISKHEFHTFCTRSNLKLLKFNINGPKIFETDDNEIIKVFYPRKKWLSSDRFIPYAKRFCDNAERLRNRGFKTLNITKVQYCRDLQTYIITYQKLSGVDARIVAQNDHSIVDNVASLLADLHNKGIFFRSIHLENILSQDDGKLALLDIVDVKFKNNPLSTYLRFRNLKHLFLIEDDKKFWEDYGIDNFLKAYFKYTHLSSFSKKMMLSGLKIYTKYFG